MAESGESRAWLERAIACFNEPDDNGEDAWEVRGALEALRRDAPHGASAAQRAVLDVLIAEADALADGPYTRARVTSEEPPRVELLHHARGEWIPATERAAERVAARGSPTGTGPRATWTAFAADAPPERFPKLEATFVAKTGSQLTHLVSALVDAGELDLAESIARTVLAQHPRFPEHWWCRVGEAQLRRAPASARLSVSRALLYAEKSMPHAVSLWFRVEEACGLGEDALAVIYVGGRAHGFALEKPASWGGLGARRLPKPARAKARFAEQLASILREAWHVEPVEDLRSLRQLAGVLRGLGKVVPAAFLAEVEAEVAAAEQAET